MSLQRREAEVQHELAEAAMAVAHLAHARWQFAVGGNGAAAGLTPAELQTLLKAGKLQVWS